MKLPKDSSDAALRLNLAPGNYVAQANRPTGAGGMMLVAIYEMP